jgi:ABC-type transport system involved in cytochrome c biogenesis permease subunit
VALQVRGLLGRRRVFVPRALRQVHAPGEDERMSARGRLVMAGAATAVAVAGVPFAVDEWLPRWRTLHPQRAAVVVALVSALLALLVVRAVLRGVTRVVLVAVACLAAVVVGGVRANVEGPETRPGNGAAATPAP